MTKQGVSEGFGAYHEMMSGRGKDMDDAPRLRRAFCEMDKRLSTYEGVELRYCGRGSSTSDAQEEIREQLCRPMLNDGGRSERFQ